MRSLNKSLLKRLGYDISKKGADYVCDLLDDVACFFAAGVGIYYIRKMIPGCCVEFYHFDYAIGRIKYYDTLNEFFDSRVITEENKDLNKIVFPSKDKPLSLEDRIIYLLIYINNNREELVREENNKEEKPVQFVKKDLRKICIGE